MFFDASIDADAAARFLADHLGRTVDDVVEVGAGAWSNCFGFTDSGTEYVIRFGNHVDDYQKDQVASAFSSTRLPIPVVTEVGAAFPGYFAISTRAHGEPLELLGAADWAATVPELLAVLDEMRAVPIDADAGFGGWGVNGKAPFASWRDFLLAVSVDDAERRTHGWTTKLADSPFGDQAFHAGYARLAEVSATIPSPQFLVHSDLINRNVLVRDRRITAVFDWGCSFYGDFLYDIAWIEFWASWYPAMSDVDFLAVARAHLNDRGVVVQDFDARVRCCLLHIGLDHLAYNAFTGNMVELGNTVDRLAAFV